MCKFKFCAGAHACFLQGSSPCPHARAVPDAAPGGGFRETADRLGLRGRGFLDRDQLIAALGLDDAAPAAEQSGQSAKIVRITSKLHLAAQNMADREAS